METAVTFECGNETLVGIVHQPQDCLETGVLVIVGGPQYRVGSHRQFVLLARHLARHRVATFRFDHRGIGDSGGNIRRFDELSHDIECAIDKFMKECPAVKQVFVWGLCDAASAALMYAATDTRVYGLVLLNPWVRADSVSSGTYYGRYYYRRIKDWHAWKNLLRDPVRLLGSAVAAAGYMANRARWFVLAGSRRNNDHAADLTGAAFVESMLRSMEEFSGPVHIVLSGDDLTAAAFQRLIESDDRWRKAVERPNVSRFSMKSANHTFSRRTWRDEVSQKTAQWLIDA